MKTREHACVAKNCHKSFRDHESLVKHLQTCKGSTEKYEKTFTCQVCQRVLATKQSLKEHTFVHREKKTFRCSEIRCGKMFKQNSQLCNHRKIHKEARNLLKKNSQSEMKISHESNGKNFDFEEITECFVRQNNYFVLPFPGSE